MFKPIRNIIIIVILLINYTGWLFLTDDNQKERISLLEAALQVAGDNRIELEKVLCLYKKNPADSLKYKAACFLIENMPFYAYSDSEQFDNYKSYYAWLKKSKGKTPQQVADSVKKVFGPIRKVEKKKDIHEIDSAYLCHNIDWAFKVWKEQPWGKNISFEIFCEYLLPYRIDDEPLVYWREMYYEKYNLLLDSLRLSDSLDIEDPIVAANYLISKLPNKRPYYTSVSPYPFGHIGPDYVKYISGTCRELTDYAVYIFRALGIPCAIDYIPVRNYFNAGHFWLTTWNKNGEEYVTDFPKKLIITHKNMWYFDDSPKLYRNTFSVNRALYNQMSKYGEEVFPYWRLPKFKDITYKYCYRFSKVLNIPKERMYKNYRKGKIAYLCISNRNNWVPVDWTEYNASHLSFRYVRNGAIMRVATYEDGLLQYLTDPFCVERNDKIHYYYAGKKMRNILAYAKCDIGRDITFQERMLGGVFEGSNSSDFANADTFYIIQKKPVRLINSVKSWSDNGFRYLRYIGSSRSHCNVAEVGFYEKNDTVAISGKVIGTPGSYTDYGMHEYTNVFDGNTETSFNYIGLNGGWAGIDVGRKVKIDSIVFTPRNRDNYIRPGDTYELFYCDRDWKSVATIKATSDSLVFRDIPENTVLFLRNHTRGVDERIFIYEKGMQIWK